MKKGVFFSADALIALMIIFFVILLIAFSTREDVRVETEIHYDILNTLSNLKVGEINNAYVQSLISSGRITKVNNSLLQQIGEFYVVNITEARALAGAVLSELNFTENVGIWYGSSLVYSKNSTPYETASDIDTARKILSGISGDNGSVTGFSARAFLSNSLLKKYYYFGGYVGDGNISLNVSYSGDLTSALIEAAVSDNFQLYVNGVLVGVYGGSGSEFTPVNYSIPINNFVSGDNVVSVRGNILHIAGGFVKITYQPDVEFEQPEKYKFPGVEGAINVYDGFYVPENIDTMDIFLHLNSSAYNTFLSIGNVTVFNRTTNGEEQVTISNAVLASLLNYNEISKKSVPIRLGLGNITNVHINRNVDAFSVTDISGSMGGQKITDAKNANKNLIDVILNYSENRVGLVGYDTWAKKDNYHNLSNNTVSLKNEVDSWSVGGYTCICCGILKAINCFDPAIFNDNFNGQSVGSNPIGWQISEGNGTIDITSSALEGNRAVSIKRLSTQDPVMSKYFAPQEDKLSIEFLVNHSSGTGGVRIEVEGATSGFGASFSDYIILKMGSGWIKNNDAKVVSYNTNTVYKIRIEVVPGANSYNLYVNDILVGSSLVVYSTRDNIARVTFTTESGVVSYVTDDVKVFLTNNICQAPFQDGKAIIIMSDGQANRACGLDPVVDYNLDGDTTDDVEDHAVQAACDAYNKYNITVHAVGFGGGADETTLQRIAACGNGSYYFADVGELASLYSQIANDVIAQFFEQTLEIQGEVYTKVYPDSYIKFGYNKSVLPHGLVITLESGFDNIYGGDFSVPADVEPIETVVTSYSGPRWTSTVDINRNNVYNLGVYANDFLALGDPYIINIPNSLVPIGNISIINLTTGVSPANSSGGSMSNKIIYTILKNATSFSSIVALAQGCIWSIEFEDGNWINATIPDSYSGGDRCYYDENTGSLGSVANENDAFQLAVLNLLRSLDIDSDGKIDLLFMGQDLQVSFSEVTGIPFTWSIEVQARRWH